MKTAVFYKGIWYSHRDKHQKDGEIGSHSDFKAVYIVGKMPNNDGQDNRKEIIDEGAH